MQRSIELLDKVLSEYDEHDTEAEAEAAGALGIAAAARSRVLASPPTTRVRP